MVAVEDRLFPEEDPAVLSAAAEEMLRSLVHKVPAQMAEAEQVCGASGVCRAVDETR